MATKPTTTQIAATATRTQADVNADSINVRDYGATGDGATNDSTAVQAAITAAQAAGKDVYFPSGSYVISSLGTQSGRLFLRGSGNATLKGTLTYSDTFSLSADTNSPLTPTSKYFSATGLNFQSTGTGAYGLQLLTVEQGGFLSTFNLSHCRFFGPKGLLARHMIGFELSNCEFNNTIAGSRYEGCVNGMHIACRWQNQAESGTWITYAPDHGSSGVVDRRGGENLKFSFCEWAVCTYGMVADNHMWLSMSDCLMDYCAVPLFLSGSNWAKATNSYFGASNHAVSRFSGVSGYVAPVTSGVAVYGRPGGYTPGTAVVGFTAYNCEFISYVGTGNPIVSVDGYLDGSYPQSADEIQLHGCLVYATQSHIAATMVYVNAARGVRIVSNRFRSSDLSTSLTSAYILSNCSDPIGYGNDFWNCRQSGAMVSATLERPIGSFVQSTDPGAVGAGVIWVAP